MPVREDNQESSEGPGKPRTIDDLDAAPSAILLENLIEARSIVIAFSSLAVDGVGRPFELAGLFERTDCACILVRDIKSSWYHCIDGIEGGVPGLAEYLRRRTARYERVICVGHSMGGYAALLFGDLLAADEILTFDPQTALSTSALLALKDRRWEQFLSPVRAIVGDCATLDLGPESRARKITVYVAASGIELDRSHAHRLLPRARIVQIDGALPLNHGWLFVALRESGQLRCLIDAAVAGETLAEDGSTYHAWEAGWRHQIEIQHVAMASQGAFAVSGSIRLLGGVSMDLQPGSRNPVRLGARVFLPGQPVCERDYRFDFPMAMLEPGIGYPFHFRIPSSEADGLVRELRIALVKKGRFWFDDMGMSQALLAMPAGQAAPATQA